MITVVTPFQRKENLPYLEKLYKDKVNWVVLIDDDSLIFPDWVTVRKFDKPPKTLAPSNYLINEYIATTKLDPEMQYMVLCDDDAVEDGFFDKIPNEDVVLVSMQRNDIPQRHVVWDDWYKKLGHFEDGVDLLEAKPENLKMAKVGGEQLILKGKVLRRFRYGLGPNGDGEMVLKVAEEYPITYVPDAKIYFNYFEDGRWQAFRRKPLVLFIGDYFCAATPKMGKSEWENGLVDSLDASGVADVLRFNPDRYFYEYGKRADEAVLDAVKRYKPDYVVLVLYKAPGSDQTVISLDTIANIGAPLITIWGDLEAEEQLWMARGLQPMCHKIVCTANKAIADRFGFTYLHVPKDPRIFNDPNKTRDIDVVFSGSYGYGREERQKYMNHLLTNGIKLVHGGSEGGDHFTTEEYADRYKRAKIALSFSQARGMNVVNARVFEAMNCGAMLMEQESLELAKLYTPYVDYVPWTTEDDLLTKVRYYLEHDSERLSIAQSGCKKTQELYSAKTFWSKVLE